MKPEKSIALVAASLVLAGACSVQKNPESPAEAPLAAQGEAPPAGEAPPQDPNWFEELLAREATPLEERRLASGDGVFETLVAAEIVAEPENIEGDYYFQLGLGTEVPMECWVYPEGHDLAGSHQQVSEQAFQAITEAYGEIEAKAIQRVDAGVFGGHGYMALDWLYRVKSEEGSLAGQIKHVAAAKGDGSAYCQHNESGYSATFEKVFRGMVEHLAFAAPAPRPYYKEVSVVRFGDSTSGIAWTILTLDEEGDTEIIERMSLLLPVDQQTLMASDNYNIQFSTPDGQLINEVDVEAENGDLSTQLALTPTDDGAWQVSGTLQSKDFEASLEPKELPSSLGQMLAMRRFLATAEAGDKLGFSEWMASGDPTAFVDVEMQVERRNAEGIEAVFTVGPLTMKGIVDGNGSLKSGTMVMGPIEFVIERVYVEGSLPTP